MKKLKKYPNRRVYDPQASEFLKIGDLRQMVLDNEPFEVVDSKTGEDLTNQILLQIISERESDGESSILTTRILEEVIRFYGDEYNVALRPFFEKQVLQYLKESDKLRRRIKDLANYSHAPIYREVTSLVTDVLKSASSKRKSG